MDAAAAKREHSQFELTDPPTDVISAVKFAPNLASRLIVSSWDRHVYVYDTQDGAEGRLVQKIKHRAPVLDVCFGKDENEAFSVGLDWDVRRLDLTTGNQTVLSSHNDGANKVAYSPETKLLISASWDKTLHLHFPESSPQSHSTISLPQKPYSISLTATKIVVAMANRVNHIYELEKLATAASQGNQELHVAPWQERESSLKFMTRAVATMPNDHGYASSSIEGRVAVDWFDVSEKSQARKYAFKCHRQVAEDDTDVVYPVNALAFHPIHGTFASGGGDGVVALWDGVAKRRIRQYARLPSSIATLCFSPDGKFLAIGVSPGFEDTEEVLGEGVVKIFIKEIGDEAKAKASKGKGGDDD